MAARFIEVLTGAVNTPCTWQTFSDKQKGGAPWVLHGPLDQVWPKLMAKQREGHGVFVTVSQTDLRGRKVENVTGVRAVWVEADGGATLDSFHLPPSILVQSRNGQHAYWLLREDQAVSDLKLAVQTLAVHYRTDPNVTDVARVLRVPGTLHQKGEPFLVQLLDVDPARTRRSYEEAIPGAPVDDATWRAYRRWNETRGLIQAHGSAVPLPDFGTPEQVAMAPAFETWRRDVMRALKAKAPPAAFDPAARARGPAAPATPVKAWTGAASGPWRSAYVETAIGGIVDEVAAAGKGTRHDTLVRQAFQMGRLVGGGAVDAGRARDELLRATDVWGVTDAHWLQHHHDVIDSGLDKGRMDPRHPPEDRPMPGPGRGGAGGGAPGSQAPPHPADCGEAPPWVGGEDTAAPGDCPIDDNAPREVTYGERFNLSDLGNAQLMVARHGEDMRFCPQWGWFIWDGSRWRLDDTLEVYRRAKDTIRAKADDVAGELKIAKEQLRELNGKGTELEVAAAKEKVSMLQKVAAFYVRSENQSPIGKMIESAGSESTMTVDAALWDHPPHLFNAANGTIDLRTGDLRPARREDLLTQRSPVPYIPDAVAPRWGGFLTAAMGGDAALVDALQDYGGYSLTGETKEEIFVVLYGTGGAGKGTFVECLGAVEGDYRKHAEFSTFEDRPDGNKGGPREDLAGMMGKRFVDASEGRERVKLDLAFIKNVTGRDPVTCSKKYKAEFTYRPIFKLWLSTNHRPRVNGADPGLRRRVRMFPFKHPPQTADLGLKDHLFDHELPGILRWFVEGARRWYASGLPIPAAVAAETENFLREMDPLRRFLEEWCCVEGDAEAAAGGALWATGDSLAVAYREWCDHNGETSMHKNKFGAGIKERFVQRLVSSAAHLAALPQATKGCVLYEGVRLLSWAERPLRWVALEKARSDRAEVEAQFRPVEAGRCRQNASDNSTVDAVEAPIVSASHDSPPSSAYENSFPARPQPSSTVTQRSDSKGNSSGGDGSNRSVNRVPTVAGGALPEEVL